MATVLLLFLGIVAGCFAAITWRNASPTDIKYRGLWLGLTALGFLGSLLSAWLARRARREKPHRTQMKRPPSASRSGPVKNNPRADLPPLRK